MSYSVIISKRTGEEILVQDPDPKLATKEARMALAQRIREHRKAMLDARGGAPIELEDVWEEFKDERGSR